MMRLENKKLIKWNAEFYFKLNEGVYVDLNILYVDGALLHDEYITHPRHPKKEFIESSETVRNDAQSLIISIIDRLKQYQPMGRLTILRSIWSFLVYQERRNLILGSENGLDEYYIELKSRIRTYQLKDQSARANISIVQGFLVQKGELVKTRYFQFKKNKHFSDDYESLNCPYTERDFKNVVTLLFSLYENYESVILDHVDAWNAGYRNQFITEVPIPPCRISIVDTKGEIHTQDVLLGMLKLNHFFLSSLFIFALFTWGNTTQITKLKRDDMKLGEDGAIDTDYVLKGRGFRFVHLTIGKSEFDGTRAGYKWFNRYLVTIEKLVNYLESVTGKNSSKYLFPHLSIHKTNTEKSEYHLDWKAYTNNPGAIYASSGIGGPWSKIREAFKQNIPKPLVPRFRKTAEQMTDAIVRCPFTTMEKAQHNWETYRLKYAYGNPRSARENMTKALDVLVNEGIASLTLKDRQNIASRFGIDLYDGTKSTTTASRLPNGLGCKVKDPPTEIEEKYIHRQKQMGRSPKVCADLSNCVYCQKSCVIDTIDSVYHLLSFMECIKYGKPTWINSSTASEKYEDIIGEIELRLGLVRPTILHRAKRLLRQKGLAAPWSLS